LFFFYGGVLGLFDFSLLYLSSSECSGPRRRAVKGQQPRRGSGAARERSRKEAAKQKTHRALGTRLKKRRGEEKTNAPPG